MKKKIEKKVANALIVEDDVVLTANERQDKVQKWYQQISHQITLMAQNVMAKNEEETQMHFSFTNTEMRAIKAVQAPGDDNCLFAALAHQLFQHSMGSQEMK